ncbi:hypothetical protein CERSUDRAFT_90166 [Gelatoporia subvermispora B]|uniref:Uncharacterized protein n=1 Tax=Ceriporiopsis subvermispora (strain B) TaxID=914234 RepID=M2QWU0_CERS8|nr:hypothetical protein CERSUDRAFT_90166 [Gelatoporia subvermispora B]
MTPDTRTTKKLLTVYTDNAPPGTVRSRSPVLTRSRAQRPTRASGMQSQTRSNRARDAVPQAPRTGDIENISAGAGPSRRRNVLADKTRTNRGSEVNAGAARGENLKKSAGAPQGGSKSEGRGRKRRYAEMQEGLQMRVCVGEREGRTSTRPIGILRRPAPPPSTHTAQQLAPLLLARARTRSEGVPRHLSGVRRRAEAAVDFFLDVVLFGLRTVLTFALYLAIVSVLRSAPTGLVPVLSAWVA